MKPATEMPGPHYQPLLELLRTTEAIWNASRIFFDRWDLSPSQFNVLNLLRGTQDGLTQSELSRELIMHRSNVTGLVDRLEARGLVRRAAVPGDRRAWRVGLTKTGRDLMAQVLPAYYNAAEKVWSGVAVQSAQDFLHTLRLLKTNAAFIAAQKS